MGHRRDEFATRGAGGFSLTAAPGVRYVESGRAGTASLLYLDGSVVETAVSDAHAPDAVVFGEPTDPALALADRVAADAPWYGPPACDAPAVTALDPGEGVDVGDVAVGACPPDDGRLAVTVRVGGVAVLLTPDATLAPAAEARVAERAADALVDEPTRFHDHRRLHGAVNVLDVPRVAGESRLVDDALRSDVYLLDDRGFGAEMGRQLADAGVSAETTRLASRLGPDGNGRTHVRHDAPDEVGAVRAATRNGFVVETAGDAEPTVRAVSRALVDRGPQVDPADPPEATADDEMEPDGRYDPDGDLDG
jgi:hypothetical protein